jgi:hypothetical protein
MLLLVYLTGHASSYQLTLELALGSFLDSSLDLVICSTILDTDSQVDDGDIGSWNTHRHAGKLAIQVWDDLANSLSGASGRWNDVLSSSAATTPVLCRWSIDGLLGGGVRVDSGHEAFDDGVFIVNDLSERGQAVGCA